MKKIPTLFQKDYISGEVLDQIKEINLWVLEHGIATRKFDGEAVLILEDSDGLHLYVRQGLYPNNKVTKNSIGKLAGFKNKLPFRDGTKNKLIIGYDISKNMVELEGVIDKFPAKSLRIAGNFADSDYPSPPENSFPCQERDLITGHHPHWVLADRQDPRFKYAFEAFDDSKNKCLTAGTYELCGPKVQNNPEKLDKHILIKHKSVILGDCPQHNITIDSMKQYLLGKDIEGIVWYNANDPNIMCKLRKEKDLKLCRETDETYIEKRK